MKCAPCAMNSGIGRMELVICVELHIDHERVFIFRILSFYA
jgi:hypothetical protein